MGTGMVTTFVLHDTGVGLFVVADVGGVVVVFAEAGGVAGADPGDAAAPAVVDDTKADNGADEGLPVEEGLVKHSIIKKIFVLLFCFFVISFS